MSWRSNSLDQYTSSRILRNYPASREIMPGNGWTYMILGSTKESVDQYSGPEQSEKISYSRNRV